MLAFAAAPADLRSWLIPQQWEKQRTGPVIGLGEAGEFDDMHIFAPCVGKENGRYYMWYPGSRGKVSERLYRIGLAISDDAGTFNKRSGGPVFEFGDSRQSVLTPNVLRSTDGTLIRENGKLRMWFTGLDLKGGGEHVLYETRGAAPDRWEQPSPPLLRNCYAPTVLKEAAGYRMWYVDVAVRPWVIRHAQSRNGSEWTITKTPAITVESHVAGPEPLVHYPAVVKVDGVYLMWYSSRYWWPEEARSFKTAVNFAVSRDGLIWHKHPDNPVMHPDPSLRWESYFNSSLCVVQLPDQSWRIWYGGRKEPPWDNMYFSIATATWPGWK